MNDPQRLIQALETADFGSRELDAKIHCATSPRTFAVERDDRGWAIVLIDPHRAPRPYYDYPYYSTSIDAALSLLPDEVPWRLSAAAGSPTAMALAECGDRPFRATAGTPALALCIVALKLHFFESRGDL